MDPAIGVCLGPGTQKVQLELSNIQLVGLKNCWFMDTWILGICLHAISIFADRLEHSLVWSTW
jgi:hypothetical protein